MQNLFLSIDGIEVDGIKEGDYTAYEEELGVSDRMISGRRVEELRSTVWVVQVNWSSLSSETIEKLQIALHQKRQHELFFLPSTGGTTLASGLFHLVEQPQPSLSRWYEDSLPEWSGFMLRFEEITGHD